VPKTARIGVLSSADNPLHAPMLNRGRQEAIAVGVELEVTEAGTPGRIEIALEGLSRKRVAAVLVLGDGMLFLNRWRASAAPDPASLDVREHRACRGWRIDGVLHE
jgi:hypothetical protein